MFTAFWRRWLRKMFPHSPRNRGGRPRQLPQRPRVEPLESRTLLDVGIGGVPVSSPEGTAIALQGIVTEPGDGLSFSWRAATGVSRSGLQFDGLNDTVVINRQVQDDFTLEAWIKTTTSRSGSNFFEGLGLIYADVAGVNNDFGMSILNNKLAFGTGKPDRTITSSSTVTSGEWVHVAATRVRSTGIIKVFINGVQEASLATGNISALNAQPLITIGGNTIDRRYFNGVIDEVRVWNVARTAAEIQADMDRTLTGSEAGLVNYYRFDEGSGGTASDQTGSGNNGKLGNGVAANQPAWVNAVAPVQGQSLLTAATQDFLITPDDNQTLFVFFKAATSTGVVSSATAVIPITNVAPAAAVLGAPFESLVNGPIDLAAQVSDPGTRDTFSYSWTVTRDGAEVAAGSGESFTFTPQTYGLHSVSLTVTDKDGDSGTAGVDIDVLRPTARAGADQSAEEGQRVHLHGEVENAAVGVVYSYAWQVADADGRVAAEGSGEDFSFTPDDDGTYTATLTVSDASGVVGVDDLVVTVANASPTVSVQAPVGGVRGQPRTFFFQAADPSSADAQAGFRYLIDWGDGSPLETVAGPGEGVEVTHIFSEAGTYEVTVTALDKDDGQSERASAQVVINVVELQPDPLHPDLTVLAVGGTMGNDSIIFRRGRGDTVVVMLNGRSLGSFAMPSRLLVFGQAGRDWVVVSEGLHLSAWLDGGEGDDRVVGRPTRSHHDNGFSSAGRKNRGRRVEKGNANRPRK